MFTSESNKQSDVLIFNEFPSFLTLVPLKIIHIHAKSGIQHHLVIIKGTNLSFQYSIFPMLTPSSPAVPIFLQLTCQCGPCLVLKECGGMDTFNLREGEGGNTRQYLQCNVRL